MSSPDLSEAERVAVAAVLRTPSLSMGGEILGFEAAFRDYTGLKHAIGVNSGTAGLHLCVRAAGIGEGDLVITTPFSFVASANVLLFERAVPIFVDVDPQTGNIDTELVSQAVTDLTQNSRAAGGWLPRKGAGQAGRLKAILPVDVFGQPADLDPICQIAQKHSLKVIEDACEALGAEYKSRKAGCLGDAAVFAFYPNKQITTGEGGMIVTDDDQAAAMMLALRNQGRAPGDTWLQHTHLGYNYRLDEMSAALGRVQMSRLEELLAKRETSGRLVQRTPGEMSQASRCRSWLPKRPGRAGSFMSSVLRRRSTATGSPKNWMSRHPGPALLPADPSAALYGRALRLPARRFSDHRGPGAAGTGIAILRRDERSAGRDSLPGARRSITCLLMEPGRQ